MGVMGGGMGRVFFRGGGFFLVFFASFGRAAKGEEAVLANASGVWEKSDRLVERVADIGRGLACGGERRSSVVVVPAGTAVRFFPVVGACVGGGGVRSPKRGPSSSWAREAVGVGVVWRVGDPPLVVLCTTREA